MAVERAPAARVLLVDDKPTMTTLFAPMLRLEGFDVRTTLDPVAAVRTAASGGCDVVIADLHMRPLNGVEFLRQLRDMPGGRDMPVAIVTADYFIDDDMLDDLRRLGATVRYKPLWSENLVALITWLLDPATAMPRGEHDVAANRHIPRTPGPG